MPEFTDIQTFIMVLFALFGGIIIIDKIIDIFKKYHAQDSTMDNELKEIKRCLDNDNKRINSLEESSNLTLRGIHAILDYIQRNDGENQEELEDLDKDIMSYLFKR